MANANAANIVDLFQAITANLQEDRESLNAIDHYDGDVGTNMTNNFQLVTTALQEEIGTNEQADIGVALTNAAQVLRQRGVGKTAPIYAQGLEDAGQRLKGQSGFSIDDILPLLEGLLSGTQRATGQQGGQGQQGSGSLIDSLLPGIMGYMQAKREGRSDAEALLQGLLASRRGSTGTAQSPQGYGPGGQDTTGKIDPGAAGAGSLLEGLFGGLLKGLLRGGQQQQAPQQAPQQQTGGDDGFGLDDLLGGFFGRQGGGGKTIQLREPPARM